MTTARSLRPHAHAAQRLVCRLLLAYCGGPWPLLAFLALTWPPRLLCRVACCAFLLAACGLVEQSGREEQWIACTASLCALRLLAGGLRVAGSMQMREVWTQSWESTTGGGERYRREVQGEMPGCRREFLPVTSKCALGTPCPTNTQRASQAQVHEQQQLSGRLAR